MDCPDPAVIAATESLESNPVVAEHLNECPSCRLDWQIVHGARRALYGPGEVQHELNDMAMARIRCLAQEKQRAPARWENVTTGVLVAMAVAGMLLLTGPRFRCRCLHYRDRYAHERGLWPCSCSRSGYLGSCPGLGFRILDGMTRQEPPGKAAQDGWSVPSANPASIRPTKCRPWYRQGFHPGTHGAAACRPSPRGAAACRPSPRGASFRRSAGVSLDTGGSLPSQFVRSASSKRRGEFVLRGIKQRVKRHLPLSSRGRRKPLVEPRPISTEEIVCFRHFCNSSSGQLLWETFSNGPCESG